MTQRKDFSSSRAATRVKKLSEDEVMFGQAAQSVGSTAAEAQASHRERTSTGNPNPKPKRGLTHQVTVLLDDDLFYRMKLYFAQPEAKWRSASVMLRELLEGELSRND